MEANDLGSEVSYMAVVKGVPVFGNDRNFIGEVAFVLGDVEVDIFDGLVIALHGAHKKLRFVDVTQINEIHERGVLLKIDHEAVALLPEPTENKPTMHLTADDFTKQTFGDKMRDGWKRMLGRR